MWRTVTGGYGRAETCAPYERQVQNDPGRGGTAVPPAHVAYAHTRTHARAHAVHLCGRETGLSCVYHRICNILCYVWCACIICIFFSVVRLLFFSIMCIIYIYIYIIRCATRRRRPANATGGAKGRKSIGRRHRRRRRRRRSHGGTRRYGRVAATMGRARARRDL